MHNGSPRWTRRTAIALVLSLGVAGSAFGADVPAEIPSDARVVAVPDSPVIVRVWEAADATGLPVPFFSVALDGTTFSPPKATSYRIELRYHAFDPAGLVTGPPVDPELAADVDTNLYIVQYLTPPLEAYGDALRKLGAEISFFMPSNAQIVRLDPATRDAVAALPFVRWVGAMHPAYRLEEFMLDNLDAAAEVYPELKYNIMLTASALETKQDVAERITTLGGIVDRAHAGKYLLEATLTHEQLLEVARFDEVIFIDRWGEFEEDMDVVREATGANFLEAVAGYTGEGVRGEVIDTGFNTGHTDFAGTLEAHTSIGSDSHGASTSGIVFGKGIADGSARGLLPDGTGILAAWSAVSTGMPRYDHTGELTQSPWFAVFQTASVGSPQTSAYTTVSADTDAALFDFDITHLQSQSNTGTTASRPQAWAKNIISVGGVRHNGTADTGDDSWSGTASIGPASDGRIKPDITHFNDGIRTTSCCGSTAYTSSFGGTSGATPIVAGHIGLIYQMWADGAFNNPVDPDASVFDNRCHMTTAKALLINSGRQYEFEGGGVDLTRVHQGWGLPDLERLYNNRFKTFIVDESTILQPFTSVGFIVVVKAGEPEFRATMTYADPPGVPGAAMHRVNDLTLRVTTPDGTVYWGNNGLLEGNFSVPGGVANVVDTVENVFIEDPTPGEWLVEVFADEINQDGHVETAAQLDADFALVVSGVQEELPPLFARLLSPIPALVDPGTPADFVVEFMDGKETIVPGSETLFYRFDSADPFTAVALVDQGDETYIGTVPGAACGETPEFYFQVEGSAGTIRTLPGMAPESLYTYDIGTIDASFTDDFEFDTGWTVVDDPGVIEGGWQRGIPQGDGTRGDPAVDFDGSGQCWITGKAIDVDLDGGPTILTSPALDATTLPDPKVTYARWFTNDDADSDRLVIEISGDDGGSWTLIESIAGGGTMWTVVSHRIADFVTPSTQVRLRFTASDLPNNSVTEAALDAFEISDLVCVDPGAPGDVNGDGAVDFTDLLALLAAWGDCPDPPADCPADFDDSGTVDFNDLLVLLAAWTG
ncbi:MAG: S8 family serine peptidase [Phycisphaerales bacterium]|nr:S8 family serine peptidase [Phycisphaerae bacterium]NNF43300.1 S8 family serine peptidase [Phycisphaerales bacterium]NNM26062.1 S8 family serine peptidase [Phycisphaerales bacterium]